MIPPTEDGFDAYIKRSLGEGGRDGVVIMLYMRYAYLIDQIPAPNLSGSELDLLRRSLWSSGLRLVIDQNPIELFKDALLFVSTSLNSDYYYAQVYKCHRGEEYDSGDSPDAAQYEDLARKIESWTPLQGLKVLESIEYLNAREAHIVDINPDTMVMIMRGKRDEEEMRRRRTPVDERLFYTPVRLDSGPTCEDDD